MNFIIEANTKKNTNSLPVIETEYEELKASPPEIELFPNTKSPIWNSMNKEKKDELINEDESKAEYNLNKNIEESSIDNNSNSIDIKKNNDGQTLPIKINKNAKDLEINNIQINEERTDNANINNNIQIEKKEKKSINNQADKNNGKDRNVIKDKENFYIQLASLSDKSLVEIEWKRLKKIYFPSLEKLTYITEQVTLENEKVYFRLLVGIFKSNENAKKLCEEIEIKKTCLIKSF